MKIKTRLYISSIAAAFVRQDEADRLTWLNPTVKYAA